MPMAEMPRILPSIQLWGEIAATICSVMRKVFSPVMAVNWYAKLRKTAISTNRMENAAMNLVDRARSGAFSMS